MVSMTEFETDDAPSKSRKHFRDGLIVGVSSTLLAVGVFYGFNSLGLVSISSVQLPNLEDILAWIYENLRLSIIPFSIVLLFYLKMLTTLKGLISNPTATSEQISQAENWVNVSISLFFGIGVIWTAIGMRSALIAGLSELDGTVAAQLGSFEILRRLIDGGILLALSTTIFGAVGGYLMRLIKILVVGAELHYYYNQRARAQSQFFQERLEKIEFYLSQIAGRADNKFAENHFENDP